MHPSIDTTYLSPQITKSIHSGGSNLIETCVIIAYIIMFSFNLVMSLFTPLNNLNLIFGVKITIMKNANYSKLG